MKNKEDHIITPDTAEQEARLREYATGEYAFRVPDHYFEQFKANIMQQLPAEQTQPAARPRTASLWSRWAAAAAVAAVVGFSAYFYLDRPDVNNQYLSSTDASHTETTTSEVIDDYVMLDNEAIYAYVSNY